MFKTIVAVCLYYFTSPSPVQAPGLHTAEDDLSPWSAWCSEASVAESSDEDSSSPLSGGQ